MIDSSGTVPATRSKGSICPRTVRRPCIHQQSSRISSARSTSAAVSTVSGRRRTGNSGSAPRVRARARRPRPLRRLATQLERREHRDGNVSEPPQKPPCTCRKRAVESRSDHLSLVAMRRPRKSRERIRRGEGDAGRWPRSPATTSRGEIRMTRTGMCPPRTPPAGMRVAQVESAIEKHRPARQRQRESTSMSAVKGIARAYQRLPHPLQSLHGLIFLLGQRQSVFVARPSGLEHKQLATSRFCCISNKQEHHSRRRC